MTRYKYFVEFDWICSFNFYENRKEDDQKFVLNKSKNIAKVS